MNKFVERAAASLERLHPKTQRAIGNFALSALGIGVAGVSIVPLVENVEPGVGVVGLLGGGYIAVRTWRWGWEDLKEGRESSE